MRLYHKEVFAASLAAFLVSTLALFAFRSFDISVVIPIFIYYAVFCFLGVSQLFERRRSWWSIGSIILCVVGATLFIRLIHLSPR
jgi:ABC-type enterochelin transport system permease subunit